MPYKSTKVVAQENLECVIAKAPYFLAVSLILEIGRILSLCKPIIELGDHPTHLERLVYAIPQILIIIPTVFLLFNLTLTFDESKKDEPADWEQLTANKCLRTCLLHVTALQFWNIILSYTHNWLALLLSVIDGETWHTRESWAKFTGLALAIIALFLWIIIFSWVVSRSYTKYATKGIKVICVYRRKRREEKKAASPPSENSNSGKTPVAQVMEV